MRQELETVLRYGMGTTEYMRSTGGYALTLECGQHLDPQAPEVAYTAIKNTLAFLKLIDAPEPEAGAVRGHGSAADGGRARQARRRRPLHAHLGQLRPGRRKASRSASARTARRCWPSSAAASCSRMRMRGRIRSGIT
jgi:hypothetical protein